MKFKMLIVVIVSIVWLGSVGLTFGQDELNNLSQLEGMIAYIGSDFNVYTLDFVTNEISQLTEDASRSSRYEFPTWSRDGQLAYFCCSVRNIESATLSIYIATDATSTGEVVYSMDGERHVYAYWSPVDCTTEDCVDLAVLIQNMSESDLSVELFNSQNVQEEQHSLGRGAPFYYSWSPDGKSLLLHRNNQSLQYYSVDSTDIVSAFDDSLGNFLSPGWSPTDDRIVFASTSSDSLSQLTLIDGDQQLTLVDSIAGVVSFSWSPDGQYVAYRVLGEDELSAVIVVDAETGQVVSRSNVSGVLSFFWSPDSSKIAYITLSTPPGTFDIKHQSVGARAALVQTADSLAWNILNVSDGSNTLLNSFVPTLSTQYILTNFDQFAQSHSIWSPDSTHLVYGERTGVDARDSLITILDVTDPDAVPISIVAGSFAIWSFE